MGTHNDLSAWLLSRLQFAFTVAIGLRRAWLTVLEGLHLATGRAAYRILFEFWLKIFGIAFGLGVVSVLVMAFEFGPTGANSRAYGGRYKGRF